MPIIYNFNKVYRLLDAQREYKKHESQVYRYQVFVLSAYFRSDKPTSPSTRHNVIFFRKYIHHGVIGFPCCSYFKVK